MSPHSKYFGTVSVPVVKQKPLSSKKKPLTLSPYKRLGCVPDLSGLSSFSSFRLSGFPPFPPEKSSLINWFFWAVLITVVRYQNNNDIICNLDEFLWTTLTGLVLLPDYCSVGWRGINRWQISLQQCRFQTHACLTKIHPSNISFLLLFQFMNMIFAFVLCTMVKWGFKCA